MADRRSRCEEPQDPPLIYFMYLEPDSSQSPVRIELQTMLSAVPEGERAMRSGEVLQRLRAAQAGELIIGESLKPVGRDPHLWEIRWNWKRDPWRAYHAEPGDFPSHLVGLRFHRKEIVEGDDDATHAAQDKEIDLATRRHDEGRSRRWGIP